MGNEAKIIGYRIPQRRQEVFILYVIDANGSKHKIELFYGQGKELISRLNLKEMTDESFYKY